MPRLLLVPQRTDNARQGAPVVRLRALRFLAAAMLVLLFASAPSPALGVSVLSDASVTPTSGTTATVFTLGVHYSSTGSPAQPAQSVSAQVGGVTVALARVSGSANDGTWQGTATLPAGNWDVIFSAVSASPPAPLLGPQVTVTGPPTPTPSPTPQPTVAPTPTPQPTATSTPPTPTPRPTVAPTPRPPLPGSQPTATPTDDPTPTQSPSASPTPTATASARPTTPAPTPTGSAEGPSATLEPSEPAADEAPPPQGSMLATFLIVGGTMSLAGAIVLARQWLVSQGARPR